MQGVSSSTCNLQETVNNISSSTKTESEKVKDLKKLNKKVGEFMQSENHKPTVVVANTIKGFGIPFMENDIRNDNLGLVRK